MGSEAKESAVAKSVGPQDEKDLLPPDLAFLDTLARKTKKTKREAVYSESSNDQKHCVKCKFNLGDEEKCHVVEGHIDNQKGISKFFLGRGEGMLPGDLVWLHVRSRGAKLPFDEGYVIEEGAKGFQCKDCKYFLQNGECLTIQGKFKPEMSCGFIVKTGSGISIP